MNDLKGFCENTRISYSFLEGLCKIWLWNEKVDHKAKDDC